jgi:hypothetical protein
VGLPGGVGRPEALGSHPGPLSFYLLAPVYRMLGGSYWALRVSTAAFQAAAIVLALWIVRRRAGTPAVIATGAMIALLELGYGLLVLTEPWNPPLPVLWFVVFLAATRLRGNVIDALRKQGREDLVAAVDRDFAGVSLDGVNPFIALLIGQMRQLGRPAAVFVLPARGPGGG